LNGRRLNPSFAGLTPGIAGLYQVNVQLPEFLDASSLISLRVGGTASNQVVLHSAA